MDGFRAPFVFKTGTANQRFGEAACVRNADSLYQSGANMNIPADLKYTKNDEWVRVDGTSCTVGITDYAQDQLSDVVYAEVTVPAGGTVKKGDVVGAIESVKAAADVYAPVSGKVSAVNDLLDETPETINSDPYGEAWLVRIEASDPAEIDALLDAAGYAAFLENRDH
jgi:glycine cleavage system H protein